MPVFTVQRESKRNLCQNYKKQSSCVILVKYSNLVDTILKETLVHWKNSVKPICVCKIYFSLKELNLCNKLYVLISLGWPVSNIYSLYINCVFFNSLFRWCYLVERVWMFNWNRLKYYSNNITLIRTRKTHIF